MKQCKHAFTLIELLVVICIIAILASMLLPALQSARESASVATCASNLSQMSKAFQMYATNFDDFMPALTAVSTTDGGTSSGKTGWQGALVDALGQNKDNSPFKTSFFCDADSSGGDDPGSGKASYSLNNLQHAVHPVIEFYLNDSGKVVETKGSGKGHLSGNKTTAVHTASSLIVIGENVSSGNSVTWSTGKGSATTSTSELNSPGSANAIHQQISILKRNTTHTTAGNLYLDGHVRHVKPQQTFPGSEGAALAMKTTYGNLTIGSAKYIATEAYGDWSDCPKRKMAKTCDGKTDANGKDCHSKN